MKIPLANLPVLENVFDRQVSALLTKQILQLFSVLVPEVVQLENWQNLISIHLSIFHLLTNSGQPLKQSKP
jgi:hypothetical protein